MSEPYLHQGAGQRIQKDLLTRWYRQLEEAPGRGEKVAYLFISGNIGELLQAFGMRLVYPEVNALQCGIKKAAGANILAAEDMGYSGDVCGYVKNDIGLMAKGNHMPHGTQLPPPDLLVCNYAGCATYLRWFEALSRYYGAEMVVLDVPYLQGTEGPAPEQVRYVVRQLEELCRVCERVTGRPFDHAGYRRALELSRRSEGLWVEILQSARRRPSPIDAYFEAVFFMAPLYVMRGTPECLGYYEAVHAEVMERVLRGLGPAAAEEVRIVVEGPPPWPHFRAFGELFKRWGAVCVASTYSKVGGVWDFGFRHDPGRPMESMAEYMLGCYTNRNWAMRSRMIRDYVRDYQADALVIHSVKSCRSFSVGQADLREQFIRDFGVPTLFIESDLADPRYFAAAQMKNRIDAFFEALEHRRVTAGA
ncbi:MAG: benzoyl-CoA reductase subunit B [Planctomycetota bacterium]|nr:MAG: benzoyl-CoA reductase subunit B [Planctomycetota bacterium]